MKFQEHDRGWNTLKNVLILLLILFFCLYLQTLFHQAFSDDDIYLAYTNRFLREAPWSEIYRFFLEPANPWEYLPLRDFTYWLDFRLYGDEFTGFHLTHLFWYALTAAAAFFFFKELVLFCRPDWEGRATLLALSGVLLFVAHPAHVEVAAWVASRKDLVAGALGLFSFAMLTNAMRDGWPLRRIVVSALLLFMACFGKSAAIAYVLFITALLYVGFRSSRPMSITRKTGIVLAFWALIVLASFIHLNVGARTGIHIENYPGVWAMLERASRILSTLIGILLLPWPMHFYYDVYRLGDWHWLVSFFALLLVVVSLYVLSKKRALWALGVILIFSPMVVYLQFAPFSTSSLASERFVFVPIAGLSLMLIDFLGRMKRPCVTGGFLFLIILPCAVITWSRINDWGGIGNALIDQEYEYQPEFHTSIRDRIVYSLIPEKRYDEAMDLTKKIQRPYAAEALILMIEADRAYQPFRAGAASLFDDSPFRREFCAAAARLRTSIQKGRVFVQDEPDVSYNSILNTLERGQKYRFGNEKTLCAEKRD